MTATADYRQIQGNVLRGYGFEHAAHLLVHGDGTGPLQRLLADTIDAVTAAEDWADDEPQTTLNLAVTYTGLSRLGLPGAWLGGFPRAFREGPRRRAAFLGDIGASDPANWDAGLGTGEVHLLLSVNSRDPERRDAEQRRLRELVEATEGLRVVAEHLADSLLNSREHFGFADGLAQPDIEGVAPGGRRQAAAAGGGVPLPGAGWRPLRLGEFVLGYTDEDGETNEGPDAGLVRNGTFMVYRRLEQRVFAFREALRDAALETGLSQETVAAKLVGRWRDGMPLELAPRRDVDDLSDVQAADPPNDFRYLPHDRTGDVCPVGAHIRRANPRDAIDFGGAVEDSGPLSARHRIIRRGMPYGESLPADAKKEDNAERGLLFVCFNADIARQFETVQANWCNDGDTFGLRNDQDYLFGNADGSGTMTIPARGSHPRFVRVPDGIVATRGAEYLLLPSLDALRGLAVGTFR